MKREAYILLCMFILHINTLSSSSKPFPQMFKFKFLKTIPPEKKINMIMNNKESLD